MIPFIIKSGICMVLFFGLYWFFLSKEKLLIFNRYFLILAILISLTMPFISFSIYVGNSNTTSDFLSILNNAPNLNLTENVVNHAIQDKIIPGPEITAAVQATEARSMPFNGIIILLFIYLTGFALMLIRFCRNLFFVNRLIRKSEVTDHGRYKLALIESQISPFSFLRTVFVNKQEYLEERIAQNVLRHELEHVRQAHSFDIIFFELVHIVFWFNPIFFLYKWAVRINHEYLADEAVIKGLSDMRSYANELINFISHRVNMPFTSGFSPSMVRLRLLMLNTNTSRKGKNIRMLFTLFSMLFMISILSIHPAYSDSQGRKTKERINQDIVIQDVYFRNPDFKPQKALFVLDGKILGDDETLIIDPKTIKSINVLLNRKAIRKYDKHAKNGIVEIKTYDYDKNTEADSLKFKPRYTVNDTAPDGIISIAISNLYSFSLWTYPIFPNQDLEKRWRTIEIMTRDYYQIRGRAVQKNGEPVQGALLTVTDNPAKVVTDKDGKFFIPDVLPGSIGTLSAEGYAPLDFKIKSRVFTTDLSITLEKIDESDQNFVPTNKKIKDFSGTWRNIIDTSNIVKFGRRNFTYIIHQYDSDSINLNRIATTEDGKEFKSNTSLVFNTVEKHKMFIEDNLKSEHICSIDNEQSFSVTTLIRSRIGLFNEQKSTETYSLSDDGKKMIIRHYDRIVGDSLREEPGFEEIFERI